MSLKNLNEAPIALAPATASLSRRRFVNLSAAAMAAGLGAGPLFGQDPPPAPRGFPDDRYELPPQQGLRALVTGGNRYPENDRSGLGYHVAMALAGAGADVTIASRDSVRGAEAVRRIAEETGSSTIRFIPLDLTDLSSVSDFSSAMLAEGLPLDLLINNAGVMGRLDRETSADGYERVFATNVIGPFALTSRLLPLLQQAAAPRVVWVGSGRMSRSLPFDDLQQERAYDYAAAYDNSKLAVLLLAIEMERRSVASGWGVTSLAAHPGVARTNLIPDGPGLNSREGERFLTMGSFFAPPEQGAQSLIYAAGSPLVSGAGYYGPENLVGPPAPAEIPPAARNEEAAARLWQRLEELGQAPFA